MMFGCVVTTLRWRKKYDYFQCSRKIIVSLHHKIEICSRNVMVMKTTAFFTRILSRLTGSRLTESPQQMEQIEQIERIRQMERSLDRASQAVMHLSAALDEYADAQDALRQLSDYYGSDQWKQDFADDEAGRLPPDLKRGVLSEDAVWNLLEDVRDLKERMREMDTNIIKILSD